MGMCRYRHETCSARHVLNRSIIGTDRQTVVLCKSKAGVVFFLSRLLDMFFTFRYSHPIVIDSIPL